MLFFQVDPVGNVVGLAAKFTAVAPYIVHEDTEAALEATNASFALAGTSSTDESFNFDRHWRNARRNGQF